MGCVTFMSPRPGVSPMCHQACHQGFDECIEMSPRSPRSNFGAVGWSSDLKMQVLRLIGVPHEKLGIWAHEKLGIWWAV